MTSDVSGEVERALGKCVSAVEPAGAWHWNCVLENGAPLPLSVHIEEQFLEFAVEPSEGRGPVAIERLLQANGGLGGARFVLGNGGRIAVRAEVVLEGNANLLPRVRSVVSDLLAGCGWLEAPDLAEPPQWGTADKGAVATVRAMLADTSWKQAARGEELEIPLEDEFGPRSRLERVDGGLALCVPLAADCQVNSDASRQALALLLLTLNGAMRLATGGQRDLDGQPEWLLRVGLREEPTAAELEHALAALATAYALCSREAEILLLDQAAAELFLAIRKTPAVVHNHEGDLVWASQRE